MTNRFLIITAITLQLTLTISQQPAEHLIPPPTGLHLPKFQRSVPFNHPPLNYSPGNGPLPLQPPPPRGHPYENPGIMQRVARWFGFGGGNNNNIDANNGPQENNLLAQQLERPKEQSSQASYNQLQYKEPPYQYQRPKATCNPCNKVPWIPMFPGNIQYPLIQGHGNQLQQVPQIKFNHHPQQHDISLPPPPLPPLQQINSIQSQQYATQSNHVQRAVRFNYPAPNAQFQFLPSPHQPIPVPNLSASPIPPLYNAVPFRKDFNQDYSEQQNNGHYTEHLSQPSEIRTQLPPVEFNQQQFNKGIEVVQSVPVTDFISSIEYPAKYSQGHVIDLSNNAQDHNDLPSASSGGGSSSSSSNHDVPKVIDLGGNVHNSSPKPEYLSEPIIVHNHNVAGDNFPEASSHNLTFRNENQLDQENYVESVSTPSSFQQETLLPTYFSNNYPTSPEPPKISTLNPDYLVFSSSFSPSPTTITPEFHQFSSSTFFSPTVNYSPSSSFGEIAQSSSPKYHSSSTLRPEFTIAHQTSTNTIVDIQPSLQTASERPDIYSKKHRDTPKNLLDAPIIYHHDVNRLPGSSPRPFTRDPSELHIRSSTYQNLVTSQSSQAPTPWAYTPTPTSTYSALDASGQWAGMSPPSQFQTNLPITYNQPIEKRPKQIQQIIIPYTTKNKPRPFKARDQNGESDSRFSVWSNSNEHQDHHDQQESKRITATHSTEQPTRRTTKYITKILASNIRELLRKEHEVKNRTSKPIGVDLNRLQKNIDGWTEQEFSSRTQKQSTVSIRGQSKHIPKEYLTTTPAMLQSKTIRYQTTSNPRVTKASLMSAKDDFVTHLWDKHNINSLDSHELSNNIDALTTKSTSTTTSTTTVKPYYIRNIKPTRESDNEIWQKVKVSISPLTKEKVYVVTPQPSRFQAQSTTTDSIGTFKSPRFLVRPTPASSGHDQSSNSTQKSLQSSYTPELFGLMGISAYIPSVPADVLVGHSKVITVVTPTPHNSNNKKRSTDQKDSSTRTTTTTEVTSKDKNS